MPNKHSRDLAEIFDDIAMITIRQSGYEENTDEWTKCEKQLKKLYEAATWAAHKKEAEERDMARTIMNTEKNCCYLCQRYGMTELHHIYPGNPRRRLSTEDGMMVYLCPDCHRAIHGSRTDKMRELQRDGQRVWESVYGSRGDFIKRYGKSYIMDEK